jgi:hypothetical protein
VEWKFKPGRREHRQDSDESWESREEQRELYFGGVSTHGQE